MKLDLAEHLRQLSRHISREGVRFQPLEAIRFQRAVRLLYNASQLDDEKTRAEAFEDAFLLFSESFSGGSPQSFHTPIDPPRYRPSQGSAPLDEGLKPIAIPCPRCRTSELVATGRGVPLPVLCRRCGYEGNIL